MGLAFLLLYALLFAVRTPAWDAAFYYAYARSAAFDGDLRLENDLRLSYATAPADFVARRADELRTPTGRVISPYAIGSGLLWLPALLILRAAAGAGQLFGLTDAAGGYGWYFAGTIAALSALLGLLAIWIGFRLAEGVAGRRIALAAALTLMFSTPLLYYQYREPLYAHATSAFVTAVVVAIWVRDLDRAPRPGRGLLLGAAIGLAALVRWQHLVYMVLPAASALFWVRGPAPERRRRPWRPAGLYLGAVAAAAAALLSLQMAQWRLFYGVWATVPQGEAFMDWQARFWPEVLFSPFRGLLAWMPVALLGTAGLALLARRQPRLALPLLAVLILETYVNSSTPDWFAGAGFGPRRYISELALLVVGYAALLQAIPRPIRRPLAVIAAAALALHQWILLRYGLVEKIGGRNRSMAPDFIWEELSYGEFGRQIASHLADPIRRPWDFFVFDGSPLDSLRHGHWPLEHVAALLLAVALVASGVFVGRRLAHRIPGGRIGWLVCAAGLAILAADLWILLAA
jgi:hypothetical protein